MYLKISAKLSQKLKLSPQLIKSINLLSLPITELEQIVQQELVENPVLEEKGNTLEDNTSSMSDQEASQMEWTQYSHISKNLPETYSRDHIPSEQETLREHLIWQVQMGDYSLTEKENLYLLVDEIDDTGYLKESIQQISEKSQKSFEELEQALLKLQEMDPIGVGARNLKECLLIQARHIQEDTQNFVTLVENHLKDIEHKNYDYIAKSMNLHKDEVMDMVGILTSMEPQPGHLFSNSQVEYVIPDVFIVKKDNQFKVVINEERIPRLQIASKYLAFLNKMDSQIAHEKDQETKEYLLQNMKKAILFIKGLNQRRTNILKLAQNIVEEQAEFLDQGEKFLKPMLLKEMAQKMKVHRSTVSRLINNKFVHTPQGTFKLKYFFGVKYMSEEGKPYSRKNIRDRIYKLISEEQMPLSDEKISQILFQTIGVRFERRQVARLRAELGLGSVKDRIKNKQR